MPRPLDRRNQVVERLREALRSGKLRPGTPLRTGVADADAWGTSHPTLRAALRELEGAGELEKAPRGFRVPVPTMRGGSTRVLWIAACEADGTIVGENERETRLRRHLDLACRRDGLQLRVAGIDPRSRLFLEGLPIPDLEAILKDAFGVVVCPWRMGPEGSALAGRLAHSRLPAALWAEGGLQDSVPTESRARIFDNGHMSDPGRHAGIHLRELGHERVAFLSVFHGANWSRRRLEGLRSAIEPGGVVSPIVADSVAPPLASFANHPDLAPVLRRFDGCARLLGSALGAVSAGYARLLWEEALLRSLEPLFEKASSDASTTAWVCSNDSQALLAMQWLRQRGIGVPSRISVVGFDDTSRGQDQGLTSWSFAEFDLAEAMVRHLVHPAIGTGTVRIDGTLVVRGSTGRRWDAPGARAAVP